MNPSWLNVPILSVLLMTTGRNKTEKPLAKGPPCEHMTGFDAASLGGKGQPYVISVEKRGAILKQYGNLQLGMNESQVFLLLGRPESVSDDWSDSMNVETCVGTTWIYPLNRIGPVPSRKDSILFVSFGHSGRVRWIDPHNISGLTPKGSPPY